MTGRELVLTLGAGVCLGLLSGCTHTSSRAAESNPPVANGGAEDGSRAKAEPVTAASPYHSVPAVASSVQPNPPENEIQRTALPEHRPEPPPPPQPLPAEEAPRPVEIIDASVPSAEIKTRPVEDPPLVAALRCFLQKQPAEAIAWLQRFDKPSQDLLLCLLPLVARLSEGNLQSKDSREITASVAQLNQAADSLRPLANLSIERICFCAKIEKYGVYLALPEDHEFRPGEGVQIYAELQNFTSEQHGRRHCIRLASTVEIRAFNGRKVCEYDFSDRNQPDLSQTPRHDFFNNYLFPVPRTMAPGMYTLWLHVTDVPTGRTASRSLDFRVIALH